MKRIRITGGPFPQDIHVVDVESGLDLSDRVLAIHYVADSAHEGARVAKATLTVFAEVDVVAEVEGA